MRDQLRKDLHNHLFSMMTGIGSLAAAFNIQEEVLVAYFRKNIQSARRRYHEANQEESQQ
jgi:hypothetical protein